jgi:hypothetical protein
MESRGWRQRRGSSPAARRGARQRAGLTPVSASNILSCERETLTQSPIKKSLDSDHGIYRDPRPFLRSLIATPNASTFFLADTSRSLLACLGSFFCLTAPQAFFCPDRRFPTPTRAAAVKDGPSSGHRFGGAQRP